MTSVMPNQPNTRTVLVAGVSHAIGHAAGNVLAQRGFQVFGSSRHPERLVAPAYESLLCDIRDTESVQRSVAVIARQTGRIDGVITVVGNGLSGAVEETSVEEAKALFDINFFGVQRMINAVLPVMRAQAKGRILVVGNAPTMFSAAQMGLYTAAAYALEGYTAALYHEVKPLGIHVSLVDPGDLWPDLDTDQTIRTIDDYHRLRRSGHDPARETRYPACDPYVVAQTIADILLKNAPRLRYTMADSGRALPAANAAQARSEPAARSNAAS